MKSIAEVDSAVNQERRGRNSKFVILDEVEWPTTGGVDMDALPTKPVGVPLSRIRALRPAKTWKTWDNTVEIRTGNGERIAVRGTLDEIVAKLNESGNTRKPFALTKKEKQLAQMRQDGYSFSECALALDMTPLAVAMADSKIEKKLEASQSASPHRTRIFATRETLAMMRSDNLHPDAIT
jgi:DNA-binding CsgD family transcriptional regulator